MTRELQGHDDFYLADTGQGQELSGHRASRYGVTRFVPRVLESPVEALDLHLREWSWSSTPEAVPVMVSFLEAYGKLEDPEGARQDAPHLVQAIENALNIATTSYVSPDVAQLVEHQGLSMPPDMLRSTDVPYPFGFVVLGKTWNYMDVDDGEYVGKIPLRVIMWWEGTCGQADGSSAPGINMALYADTGWMQAVLGRDVRTVFEGAPPPLFLVDIIAWTYDSWWIDVGAKEEYDQHHQAEHCGEFRRKLLALLRFMQEEIVYTRRHRPPRPASRRWERSKINNAPDDGCIVSVHLRRYSQKMKATDDEEREAREVFWSHRWWVRGHHRYNPKSGIKDIWVRPYIKGPEGMPLVLKEKLVSVDR